MATAQLTTRPATAAVPAKAVKPGRIVYISRDPDYSIGRCRVEVPDGYTMISVEWPDQTKTLPGDLRLDYSKLPKTSSEAEHVAKACWVPVAADVAIWPHRHIIRLKKPGFFARWFGGGR